MGEEHLPSTNRKEASTGSFVLKYACSMECSERNLVGKLRGPFSIFSEQVANAFVLYANYKNYHWQTFGLLFRDLHLMFDEFAKEVLETNDELAEGIRMIGPNIENV
jgi:hypothetical protein